jgi:hypothetical protein
MFKKKPKEIKLSDVERLVVKDGDILVFRHPRTLSCEAMGRIREYVGEKLRGRGIDVEVFILEEGMDVGVISKQ